MMKFKSIKNTLNCNLWKLMGAKINTFHFHANQLLILILLQSNPNPLWYQNRWKSFFFVELTLQHRHWLKNSFILWKVFRVEVPVRKCITLRLHQYLIEKTAWSNISMNRFCIRLHHPYQNYGLYHFISSYKNIKRRWSFFRLKSLM
jgi:hypothetical protein